MSLFKCSVCNYIHEGEEAIQCPKCGAKPEAFKLLEEEAANKVYVSDYSNDLHMELIALCSEAIDICQEGIEDDLDPTCVSGFKKAQDLLWEIKQISKAEIENHIAKGKW